MRKTALLVLLLGIPAFSEDRKLEIANAHASKMASGFAQNFGRVLLLAERSGSVWSSRVKHIRSHGTY